MDLDKKIKKWKAKEDIFDISLVLKWLVQTAEAIDYLHTLKPDLIIHRDIKPMYSLKKKLFK